MNEIATRKMALRAEQQAEKEQRRVIPASYRRCFWTRPLGHAWRHPDADYGWITSTCVGCGKDKRRWES